MRQLSSDEVSQLFDRQPDIQMNYYDAASGLWASEGGQLNIPADGIRYEDPIFGEVLVTYDGIFTELEPAAMSASLMWLAVPVIGYWLWKKNKSA